MSLEGRTIALVEDDPIMGESLRRPAVARRRQGAVVAELQHRLGEPADVVSGPRRLRHPAARRHRARTCSGRHPLSRTRRRFCS